MSGLENMISVQTSCLMEDRQGTEKPKAKEFLLEILADGGMSQKKILEEAAKRGIKGKNAEKCEVRTGSRFDKTGKSVVLGAA